MRSTMWEQQWFRFKFQWPIYYTYMVYNMVDSPETIGRVINTNLWQMAQLVDPHNYTMVDVRPCRSSDCLWCVVSIRWHRSFWLLDYLPMLYVVCAALANAMILNNHKMPSINIINGHLSASLHQTSKYLSLILIWWLTLVLWSAMPDKIGRCHFDSLYRGSLFLCRWNRCARDDPVLRHHCINWKWENYKIIDIFINELDLLL